MIHQTSLASALLILVQVAIAPQEAFVPSFGGRVYADRRPVNWMLEVRLEGQDSSLVATAYTRGSSEFQFRNVSLRRNQNYYLVIREPGFQEIRHILNFDDFVQDTRNPGVYAYSGIIVIYLERIPTDEKEGRKRITGPKAVDVQQLSAQIPESARREYELAMKEIAAGSGPSAVKRLEKAVELAPNYYDALNKLGLEYLRTGQRGKAETILIRARTINPNDPLPLTNLGTLYFQEGEGLESMDRSKRSDGAVTAAVSYQKAVEAFEEALRLDPMAPRAKFYLGTALYKIGAYERAESLLVNALLQDKEMREAHLTLLNIYIRQQRYDDALQQISAYLDANPDSPQREQLQKLKTKIEEIR